MGWLPVSGARASQPRDLTFAGIHRRILIPSSALGIRVDLSPVAFGALMVAPPIRPVEAAVERPRW